MPILRFENRDVEKFNTFKDSAINGLSYKEHANLEVVSSFLNTLYECWNVNYCYIDNCKL